MRCWALASAVLVVFAACTGSDETSRGTSSERRAGPGGLSSPSVAAPAPPTQPVTTTTVAPVFAGTVAAIGDAERARMTTSWRLGCPLPLEQLRILTLDHWGYDGLVHRGELVVHGDYADAMVNAFRRLFEIRFPIERMQLVDEFGGDDFASTLANNTAAFNCRAVVGRPGSWSEHAFGRAIDVNPRVNPYVLEPRIQHPELAPFLDRSRNDPGIIRAGDDVVQAFASVGWQWGGTWSSPDYQHFSATGR